MRITTNLGFRGGTHLTYRVVQNHRMIYLQVSLIVYITSLDVESISEVVVA
jgi:hypothetical protein